MGWLFELLFGGKKGKAAPKDEEKSYGAHDDGMYKANQDILEGLMYVPPLQLRIPLKIIRRHGEIHKGPYSTAPKYHELDCWVPLIKKEYRTPMKREAASDIGPVDPEEYAAQLVKFREIVECDSSNAEKILKIEKLGTKDAIFKKYLDEWYKLPNFPHIHLGLRDLLALPGVGGKTAKTLYSAGYTGIETIAKSSPEEIEKIEGIGKKTAGKIHKAAIEYTS